MKADTFNDKESIVPNWLLPCTCGTQRCHCNSRFKPNILCVQGLPYQNTPPTNVDQTITVQFIEFTYYNDRFSPATLEAKTNKYQPLIENIAALNWKIDPLIVITAGARGSSSLLLLCPVDIDLGVERTDTSFTSVPLGIEVSSSSSSSDGV